jgi:hypothetical protein
MNAPPAKAIPLHAGQAKISLEPDQCAFGTILFADNVTLRCTATR